MGYGPVDYQAWVLDFGFVERPGKNISSIIGGKNAVPAVLAPAADKVSDHCPSVGGGAYDHASARIRVCSYIFFYGENKKGYVIKTYPFLYLNRGLIKLSSP